MLLPLATHSPTGRIVHRGTVALLIVACGAAAPDTAPADTITYDFTGIVTSATGDYTNVPIGATVTGTYTFDLGNANPPQSLFPISLSSNWYAEEYTGSDYGTAPSSAYVFTDMASSSDFAHSSPAPGGYVSETYVQGYVANSSYEYSGFNLQRPTSDTNTYAQSYFILGLGGTASSPQWGSNGLPLPIVSGNSSNVGAVQAVTNDNLTASLEYEITSLTPVPLPAAAWLLLSGLGALGFFARKRQLTT